MAGSPQQNLHMFEKLTGSRSAKNVVLATTMWDEINPKLDDGDKRETGLKEKYWNTMIRDGAAVERSPNTSDSACRIVDNITERNKEKPRPGPPVEGQNQTIHQSSGRND